MRDFSWPAPWFIDWTISFKCDVWLDGLRNVRT